MGGVRPELVEGTRIPLAVTASPSGTGSSGRDRHIRCQFNGVLRRAEAGPTVARGASPA